MPVLSRITLFMAFAFSCEAAAEIMNPELPQRSFGLGLGTLYVEQPDQSSEQRYRWDLQEWERLPYNLRLHSRLGIGRDTRPRADSIAVQHHFHELYSGLQYTGTKLFRYAIGAGPLLLLEQTITQVHITESKRRTNNRWQLGWLAEAEVDYAFNDRWELAVYLAFQFRSAVDKEDVCFGVSLQFNSGIIRKDDPLHDSTH